MWVHLRFLDLSCVKQFYLNNAIYFSQLNTNCLGILLTLLSGFRMSTNFLSRGVHGVTASTVPCLYYIKLYSQQLYCIAVSGTRLPSFSLQRESKYLNICRGDGELAWQFAFFTQLGDIIELCVQFPALLSPLIFAFLSACLHSSDKTLSSYILLSWCQWLSLPTGEGRFAWYTLQPRYPRAFGIKGKSALAAALKTGDPLVLRRLTTPCKKRLQKP